MTARRNMAAAISAQRPAGMVPQQWVVLARVDDDPDAISWLPGWGWVVDVTITQGDSAGEGPLPCRVATSFAASLNGRVEPITRGQEGIVVYPGGDPNQQPVFIGYLQNPTDGQAPTQVNGLPVDEALAMANHILVSPWGRQEQLAGAIHVKSAATHTLAGALVELGLLGASQPFVRGLALRAATTALVSATQTALAVVGAAFSALAGFPAFFGPIAAACTAAATACGAVSSALGTYGGRIVVGDVLSSRVRGD